MHQRLCYCFSLFFFFFSEGLLEWLMLCIHPVICSISNQRGKHSPLWVYKWHFTIALMGRTISDKHGSLRQEIWCLCYEPPNNISISLSDDLCIIHLRAIQHLPPLMVNSLGRMFFFCLRFVFFQGYREASELMKLPGIHQSSAESSWLFSLMLLMSQLKVRFLATDVYMTDSHPECGSPFWHGLSQKLPRSAKRLHKICFHDISILWLHATFVLSSLGELMSFLISRLH